MGGGGRRKRRSRKRTRGREEDSERDDKYEQAFGNANFTYLLFSNLLLYSMLQAPSRTEITHLKHKHYSQLQNCFMVHKIMLLVTFAVSVAVRTTVEGR